MNAVFTEKLVKKYGNTVAVNGLDLKIEQGELYSLLGVNGAGKSTTIKILSALVRPDGGKAEIFGKDVVKNAAEVKGMLNVSPQESAVAANLTVWENLAFIAEIYGFSKAQAKEKAEKTIEEFSLEEVRNKRAKTLSGGYARRLSIAMALISEPKLLFLDEPTLGLDVIARSSLWKIIEGLKGKMTILLTTHYMEEAEELSDRIGVMVKGSLAAEGTARELTEKCFAKDFTEAFIKISQGDFCEKKAAFAEKESE